MVDEERIDIKFANFRMAHYEVTDTNENINKRIEIGGWSVTISSKKPEILFFLDELSRKQGVKGRERQCTSAITSTAVPPAPNNNTGPKVSSSLMPTIIMRAWSFDHRLDPEAIDTSIGEKARNPKQHVLCG